MPRKPGVYRTVKRSMIDALCVRLKDGTTYIEHYEAPPFVDKVQALRYLQKIYDSNRIRVIKIKKIELKDYYYFMDLNDFIEHARLIDK